jgi:2Fe-2S ferredoxin
MGKITVVSATGEQRQLDAAAGDSIMRIVIDSGIEGLVAECGGSMSCATCHVYVSPDWVDKVAPPSDDEEMMVDCALEVRENSRLSCQLIFADALDGLVIEIPASQY